MSQGDAPLRRQGKTLPSVPTIATPQPGPQGETEAQGVRKSSPGCQARTAPLALSPVASLTLSMEQGGISLGLAVPDYMALPHHHPLPPHH